jgi:NitT/TauT family transport system permease protein
MILAIDLNLVEEISIHLAYSLFRTIFGLFIGGLLGIPLGLMLGQNKSLDQVVSPFLYITYPFPKVVLVPILILFLGIGEVSKISLISIITFYQLVVTSRDASKSIPKAYFTALYSLGGNVLSSYRHIIIPASLPKLYTCIRISLSTSLAVLFFTETYATSEGIGFYVWDAFSRYDYPKVYLGSAALCFLGLVLFTTIDCLERRTSYWNISISS